MQNYIGSMAVACLLTLAATSFSQTETANNALLAMVIELLNDSDSDIRSLAFEQIRSDVPGVPATQRLAEELPKLEPDAQAGLLSAFADRGDRAAKPIVLQCLSSRDPTVQAAAARALGKLGDASDCSQLIRLIGAGDASIEQVATRALVMLPGADTNAEILAAIQPAATKLQPRLIAVLAERRALDTIPALLDFATGNDQGVRSAAMNALGRIGRPADVAGMARAVLKASNGAERANSEKAIMFVCARIDEKEQRAQPLLAAMQSVSPSERLDLLSTLGRIGGSSAIDEVDTAIASRTSSVHAAGLRALANWPDASVADRLIEIAKHDRHADHQRIARMALLRIAPLPDGRTDEEKLQLLQTGIKLAKSDAERTYALKRAAAIRLPETLRFILPYLRQPVFAQQACETIVELAHHRQLRDAHKPEFHAALDQVIAVSKSPVVVDRAQRYKAGKTWVRPK